MSTQNTEFENLSDEDLSKLIIKTEKEIKNLESENTLLERYLSRNHIDIRYRPDQKNSPPRNNKQKFELIQNLITEDYDYIKMKIKELKIEAEEEIKNLLKKLEILQIENIKNIEKTDDLTKQNLITKINIIANESTRKQRVLLKERGVKIKLENSDDQSYLINTADEKTAQLIGLKRVTGETSLTLATETKILQAKSKKLSNLKKKIIENGSNTTKLIRKGQCIDKEVKILNEKIEDLRIQIDTYKAPNALDYAKLKNNLLSLEKDVKSLNRFKYIGSLKLKNLRMKFNKK